MKHVFQGVFSLALVCMVAFLALPGVAAQAQAPSEQEIEELRELQQELEQLNQAIEEDGFAQPPLDDIVTEEVKAEVTSILSQETDASGNAQMVFEATAGEETFTVDTRQSFLEGLRYTLREGDRVYLQVIRANGAVNQVFLVDVVRTGKLFWLALLFVCVIIVVGRWRGFMSLLGLGVTLLVLFGWVVPRILAGADPVLTTVLASLVILGVNMHLSHGLNRATLYAYGATVIGLLLVLGFAEAFVAFANLSGLASEEAILLQFQNQAIGLPSGILLAGIILGAVGVLDDVAVTQGETVAELRDANPSFTRKELFARAMRVGRHHIASTVNTLVLAYAGVALSLFLLFASTSDIDALRFLNEEQVAEEIVRTLAGTMALVLTVPIATWVATFVKQEKKSAS